MTVYVDNMRAKFGRMVMCHMIADTDEELHAMARQIGVSRRWWQAPPKHRSHYDIALSKRSLAVAAGAAEISWRQTSCMTLRRAVTGSLGMPEDAESWVVLFRQERNELRNGTEGEQSPADGSAEALPDVAGAVAGRPNVVRKTGIAAEGDSSARHQKDAGSGADPKDNRGGRVQDQAGNFEEMRHA